MRHGHHRGFWLLALSGVLLAGCASHSNPLASSAIGESFPVETVRKSKTSADTEVDDKLVQAYAHFAQGVIYDLNEQSDLAQDELSKAALADPSNTDLALDLSRRYLQQKQPEKALDLLVRATAVPDASGKLFARLAMVYASLGKDDQAVQASQTAIKRSPASLDGYRMLFLIHLQKGRPKDAAKVLRQALKVPATSPEFVIDLVDLCVSMEHQAPSEKATINSDALVALRRAASQNPSNPRLRMKLGDDFSALGDDTNATQVYLQMLNAFSDNTPLRVNVHDRLARIYLGDKNYPAATEQLEAIVQDDPANSETYYLLGTLSDESKNLTKAADYFQKAILFGDESPSADFIEDAYYDLARVQIDLDQPRDALKTLDKARAKFPGRFMPEILAALAYERDKDYTNALNRFTSAEIIAKATDPARLNGSFYFDEGAAYERAGNYDQAERCFDRSLSLVPNFAEAMNYMGYMLADRGVKLEKAHDLIQKAVELEPKNPAYLDSLGWVFYKLNRPQEALPQLQKAIELTPDPDPTLYDHLGDIYASLKQPDKARDAWKKSLSIEPNDQIQKKVSDVADKPQR